MTRKIQYPEPSRRWFLRTAAVAIGGLRFQFAFGETAGSDASLELQVYDAATRQVTPCSVALWDSARKLVIQNPGYQAGFRSPGKFHSGFHEGSVKLVITKGFDYLAEEREVLLEPGKTTKCTVNLVRASPLRSKGWVCGDSHVHMKHGQGPLKTDFGFMALTARAEALDYLSVAQNWNVQTATPEILSRECLAVSTPECKLHWNMEAPKNYWKGEVSHCMGHCWHLGVQDHGPDGTDPIVELFAMSALDYQKEKVPTPNFESHAYIHAAGGIATYTHPCRIWRGAWGGKDGYPLEEEKFVSNMAQELPFDTVAGPTYDSIDIMMSTREHLVNELGQQLWFMLLNHGYRIPATASTDATFDNPGGATPGSVRVYTRIEVELTIEEVAAAMKAGRNFVTSGPLLEFVIGSAEIGDVVPASNSEKHSAQIQAWASGAPGEYLTKIEVIRNGEIYKGYTIADRARLQRLQLDIVETESAWYVARCFGSTADQVAISNPIYFEDAKYRAPEPATASVQLTVVKAGSSELLDGNYEVVQMIGRNPKVVSRGAFANGKAELTAPATARIRVSAAGYDTQTKSIFMDSPELFNPIAEIQLSEMLDWKTFENLRRTLDGIRFRFEMQPRS